MRAQGGMGAGEGGKKKGMMCVADGLDGSDHDERH